MSKPHGASDLAAGRKGFEVRISLKKSDTEMVLLWFYRKSRDFVFSLERILNTVLLKPYSWFMGLLFAGGVGVVVGGVSG